jgi:hypothetical protein
MTPWRGQTPYDRQLMMTLLANAGVHIPIAAEESRVPQVLKTAPVKIGANDGPGTPGDGGPANRRSHDYLAILTVSDDHHE